MSARLIATAVAGLLLAAPVFGHAAAQAQVPAPAAATPATAERLALAKQLVSLLEIKDQMMQPLLRMQAQMRSGAAISQQFDSNPAMRLERAKEPAKWDAAAKRIGAIQASALQRIFDDVSPDVERQSIESYARHFTDDDLRGLIQFYQTPLGRRLAKMSGPISLDSAAFVQSEVAPRIAQEMQRIQPQLQSEMRALMPKGK